ncbi:hypothetical protein BpHYR1_039473 [Brachionus plicatilis]|uniref:Uncharacterized protein n=1 Tax=Brachionus plicatilis TaxID=10195 RepID=A0A3M7QTF7_BRAPC|nr:hypothetical protein BpHYR1_039473 [Brachionus plicatilis]
MIYLIQYLCRKIVQHFVGYSYKNVKLFNFGISTNLSIQIKKKSLKCKFRRLLHKFFVSLIIKLEAFEAKYFHSSTDAEPVLSLKDPFSIDDEPIVEKDLCSTSVSENLVGIDEISSNNAET